MPYDGSGNFDRVHDWTADEAAGIKVRADRFDAENDDFATTFENCLTRDGQGKPSADINWNNKKITNLADPTTLKGALNVQTAQQNSYSFGTTAGGTTAYTLALGITVASLVDGQPFRAEINATNTGSSTLNVDSFGAKTIKVDGQDLVGGELIANSIYWFAYNAGTGFIDLQKTLLKDASETVKGVVELATSAETITGTSTTLATHPAGVNAALANAIVLFGGINGLTTENDTDTDHDIKINIGITVDSTKTVLINLQSPIVKRIDANWVEGTGNGGFPSGLSLSANTTYHMFLISKLDGTTDAGFDTSLTAVNLLSDATGYTKFRRVASIITDSSANIVQFKCIVKGLTRFYSIANITEYLSSFAFNSTINVTFNAPLNITKEVLFETYVNDNDSVSDGVIQVSTDSIIQRYLKHIDTGSSVEYQGSVDSVITKDNIVSFSYTAGISNPIDIFGVFSFGWIDYLID